MFRLLLLSPDNASIQEFTGDAAKEVLRNPSRTGQLWLDITNQKQADIDLLSQVFRFHPLALEDCLHFDQRAKLEEYPGSKPYLFIVTHNFVAVPRLPQTFTEPAADESSIYLPRHMLARGRTSQLAMQVLEMHAFLGQGMLVTIHAEPSSAIDSVFHRVRLEPQLMARGSDFVYYLIADVLCDSNFPVLEQLSDLLDELESSILRNATPDDQKNIYSLRKTLVRMRRAISPQRDVMGALFRHGGSTCISERTAPYFRDIYDHLTRVYESIEAGRDLVGNCMDSYQSTVSQRTNDIMKSLTMLSAFMLPMTFLTGFFGMNFERMPFKSAPLFWLCLFAMFVGIPVGMLLLFRRRGWLGHRAEKKKKES